MAYETTDLIDLDMSNLQLFAQLLGDNLAPEDDEMLERGNGPAYREILNEMIRIRDEHDGDYDRILAYVQSAQCDPRVTAIFKIAGVISY